jgi:hypothetical protein
VTTQSKAYTVLDCLNTGIIDLNPTEDLDRYLHVLYEMSHALLLLLDQSPILGCPAIVY